MTTNANLYARFTAAFDPARTLLELPDGSRVSYADAERETARAANALGALGLAPGDRVSVVAEKSPRYLWLYLGCLRAGLVFHPLNTGYTERELAFFIGDAGSRLVICDPALAARVAAACDAAGSSAQRLDMDAAGAGGFAAACSAAAEAFATVSRAADDDAALLYSSGTTGTPKGIRITHGNLYANACALREAWGFHADDVLVHALPVFHVHGLFITLGPALLAGLTLRFLPRFDAAAVRDTLAGATLMAGVPTYYTRLLALPGFGAADCASMRLFISGSAPLSEATFHEFVERTGHVILERYGMTETGINTSNPLLGERKPASVGPPLAGVEVRVVDAQRQVCASGDIGDIEVRGPNVFPGYWRLPEATAKAFDAGGWFDTGDQGYLDADGYLFIVGRSKDMVISGGLNVYPKEIERELEALDGIGEAAVFGVPHADFGEAVVAAVVTTTTVDEQAVIACLRGQLATFKVPKRVLVLDELPRNTMGKVQKNLLRERYATLFGA
ncbi:MAG: AMP-binding protein [Gammaproteobacteria bacterium]|nr:AMP-binding protein [Gammaproteobacteria bacterium]